MSRADDLDLLIHARDRLAELDQASNVCYRALRGCIIQLDLAIIYARRGSPVARTDLNLARVILGETEGQSHA